MLEKGGWLAMRFSPLNDELEKGGWFAMPLPPLDDEPWAGARRRAVSVRQLIEGLHCIACVGLQRCADLVSEWASNHAPGREVLGE